MNAISDLTLLDKWNSSRDARSFREIALRHSSMVYGTCRRILASASDAEEVTQDCFLKLAENSKRVEQSLPGWLHQLAVRLSLNRLRMNGAGNVVRVRSPRRLCRARNRLG